MMKTILVYASQNSQGSSSRIVAELQKLLKLEFTPYNLVAEKNVSLLNEYDLLFFLTPTYGDQELQEDIENFLVSIHSGLKGKKFIIIEIGNYYGYDDYTFGSGKIIRHLLEKYHATEFCEGLSMDSLPLLDWNALNKWVKQLNEKLSL